ncbi:ABC transporter ATP-binding protein [Leucobacter aridicollis]|uniref:ABC transporter ATP-binding protein n=1 Tax=Leucobacter aridicollis TaxID=283878 RepID=UPI000E658ACF|nr:ATP-binding cassette domain-containing protein [Leucobacter aridicollis]UTX54222.1 ABC transporter ATP-binding protein [Leucobacter aridicollis]
MNEQTPPAAQWTGSTPWTGQLNLPDAAERAREAGHPLVELANVSKEFRTPARKLFERGQVVRALDSASLTIERGESVAIVGESGSGKTTLIRQLLGLSKPTAGTVKFAGREVDPTSGDLGWLRRRTGLVFQDPYSSFNPRRTIEQSVAESLEGAGFQGEHGAMVRAVLERVGLPASAATRYPDAFSGGQRQRIAVARAIVHGPELLVGDEPVSALDVLVRARVLGLLAELRAEFGLTLVTITHDLGIVPQLAERTIVMQGGRIVEDGPTAELLAAPTHPYTRELVASRLQLPDTTWRG